MAGGAQGLLSGRGLQRPAGHREAAVPGHRHGAGLDGQEEPDSPEPPGLLAKEGATQEELELADDVQLAVYHMRNLSEEVREKFIGGMLFFRDMGFVADYLNTGSFEGRGSQPIVHVKELCEMMEDLTGDKRFTEKIDVLLKRREKGRRYVCASILIC